MPDDCFKSAAVLRDTDEPLNITDMEFFRRCSHRDHRARWATLAERRYAEARRPRLGSAYVFARPNHRWAAVCKVLPDYAVIRVLVPLKRDTRVKDMGEAEARALWEAAENELPLLRTVVADFTTEVGPD